MSTLCNSHSPSIFDSRRWKALLLRAADAWKRSQQARADRYLDLYYRRTRGERERYLSRATDHYELERLEQAWERRADQWRVY